MKNQKNNFIKLTDFGKQANIFVDKTTIYMFYAATNSYNKMYTYIRLSLPGGGTDSCNVLETCEEVLELLNN